jgi:hypothetical protein
MLSVSRISAAGCSQQTDSIAVMQVYHSDFRQILDLTYLVLYDLFNASFILQSEGKNMSSQDRLAIINKYCLKVFRLL